MLELIVHGVEKASTREIQGLEERYTLKARTQTQTGKRGGEIWMQRKQQM